MIYCQITQVNVNTISVLIREDRHPTVHDLEHMLNISQSTIHCIRTQNLQMRCVSLQQVPHLLTHGQMATHVEIYEEWPEALICLRK